MNKLFIVLYKKKMLESFFDLVDLIHVIIKVVAWLLVLVVGFILFGKQIRAGLLIRKFFITMA